MAKVYTPSQKAVILEDAAKLGITAAAEKHGVSRFAIYAWDRKVAKAAKGEGPSPTAGPAPKELEAQRNKEILDDWHRQPGLGPSQIKNQLRRKGIKTSVNTVRRVMEEAGYRPPKVERKPHDQRFEAVRPNHMWHLDFVQRNIHRANTSRPSTRSGTGRSRSSMPTCTRSSSTPTASTIWPRCGGVSRRTCTGTTTRAPTTPSAACSFPPIAITAASTRCSQTGRCDAEPAQQLKSSGPPQEPSGAQQSSTGVPQPVSTR